MTTQISSWLTRVERNKLAHLTNGYRNQRGKGITCIYWNKGSSFLHNKIHDIEDIIESHKPHVFGLGEANFHDDHDISHVQIKDYNLHLDSCVHDPELGVARVAAYTHKMLRVKRRVDLEDEKIASIWLECGLPNQKSILICIGYRQWQLVKQTDKRSASIAAQLNRWTQFLNKWEIALQEDKEVVVTLDANIDHLTWRTQNSLPPTSSSVKLKPLIDILFTKIIPLGVSQLVTGATRVQRGRPQTGLDHVYTNRVEKLKCSNISYRDIRSQIDKVCKVLKIFQMFAEVCQKKIF